MRRIVVLSGLGRDPLWDGYNAIYNPGAVGVREAHYALAREAVLAHWDESIVVVQDDIYDFPLPPHRGIICSYWPDAGSPVHVCPRAFSATPEGWQKLARAWEREGQTCELWEPDYVYPREDHHIHFSQVRATPTPLPSPTP